MSARIFQDRTKDIIRFTEERVRLTEGDFSGELINLQRSPWMIKPLQQWQDDRISRVIVLKGAGCGGTYVAELGAAYMSCVRARNVGYQIHTKVKADYLAQRLFAKCNAMPEFKRRLPKRAQNNRKNSVWFSWPNTFTIVQEASETAAASYRMDDMVADEPWQYPAGRLKELYTRTNGASNYSKEVAVSTAPTTPEHELYIDWAEGLQDEFHLCCPKCTTPFIPIIGEESQKRYDCQVIQWDEEGSIETQVKTCRLVCPSCHAEYYDNPSLRLDLLEGADYHPNNPEAPEDLYSCRWNSWVAWFVPYHDVLRQYLTGREAAKTGDTAVLMNYVIMSEARPWEGVTINDRKLKITGDYHFIESPHPIPTEQQKVIWHADDWDLEEPIDYGYRLGRFAGVDVQQDILWVWFVQASRTEFGASRLLWCGKVRTWTELHALLEFFQIPPWQVGVDISYGRGVEVALNVLEHGWIALRGVEDGDNSGFVHTWKDGDKEGSIRLPYDEGDKPWDIGSHKGWERGMPTELPVRQWSHGWIMDHLWNLRNGEHATYWGLPANLEILEDPMTWTEQEKILAQLDSTRRLRKVEKTTKNARRKRVPTSWQKRASHVQDHLFDCAAMTIVLMNMQKFFAPTEQPKP